MEYGYKIVRIELDRKDNINLMNHLSSGFRNEYLFPATYAIIKLGILKRAKVVIPESQTTEYDYIKCRCDLAKFIKVERIYLKATEKSSFLHNGGNGGDVIDYFNITDYIKKNYNIKIFHYMSVYNPFFEYVFGKYVEPEKKLDTNSSTLCGSGIHFLKSITDTENYFKIHILQNKHNNIKEVNSNGIFNKDGD